MEEDRVDSCEFFSEKVLEFFADTEKTYIALTYIILSIYCKWNKV